MEEARNYGGGGGNCPNHGETNLRITALSEKVDGCNNDMREVLRIVADVKQRLVIVEQSAKSYHKRQDEACEKITHLEQAREDVLKLANSIENLAANVARSNELLAEHESRIDCVERSAGNFMIKLATSAALVLVGIAISIIASKLGLV